VHWEKSPVEWSSRWDLYMGMGDSQSIHWFSILNSSMIVLFLTGMVALIMIRTLRSDLKRYPSIFLARRRPRSDVAVVQVQHANHRVG
jgi:hypothetical protein